MKGEKKYVYNVTNSKILHSETLHRHSVLQAQVLRTSHEYGRYIGPKIGLLTRITL